MMRALNILALSRLYPSPPFPDKSPFVRDEVLELAKRHAVRVIAPLALTPTRPGIAQQVLATPGRTNESGVEVLRPRVLEIPHGGLFANSWFSAWRLEPLLRRTYLDMSADIIHAHFGLPDGFVASRFALHTGAPFVLTVRGSDVLVHARQKAGRWLLTQTIARAGAIIAVSDELASRVEELGAPSKLVHVITGGVPYPPSLTRESVRHFLGIPNDAVCLVWVGRLVDVKQPLDAIVAFRMLRDDLEGKQLRLVIIGDGPLRGAARDLIGRSNLDRVVQLLGQCSRQKVWSWQSAADVLVNSSSSEGTPISVLETLGAGTPVVAYPLPGVRAVIDMVDGGTIAYGHDPRDLASALDEELSVARDRNRLATRARRAFDVARAVESIEDVYATVV